MWALNYGPLGLLGGFWGAFRVHVRYIVGIRILGLTAHTGVPRIYPGNNVEVRPQCCPSMSYAAVVYNILPQPILVGLWKIARPSDGDMFFLLGTHRGASAKSC